MDAPPLAVECEPVSAAACVVAAHGQIDLYSAGIFQTALAEAVEAGYLDVTTDLTGVNFIDSTGLAVLAALSKRLRLLGGTLSIVSADETLGRVFELAGLAQSR
jgi:anti-anti-sigma factor